MELGPLIAEHIEQDPACLREALATLDRWAELQLIPESRLAAWRRMIREALESAEGRQALLDVLRGPSEESRRLRDFAPFAGILSREERRRVFQACTYDH